MKANYGYSDGSGDYFITINMDDCDGCAECVKACPKGLFVIGPDDYEKMAARVSDELTRSVGILCPGYERCRAQGHDCHAACHAGAITHSW